MDQPAVSMYVDIIMDNTDFKKLSMSEWRCNAESVNMQFVLKLGLTRDGAWRVDPKGPWYLMQPYMEILHKDMAESYLALRGVRRAKKFLSRRPDLVHLVGYQIIQADFRQKAKRYMLGDLDNAAKEYIDDFKTLCAAQLSNISNEGEFFIWASSNRVFTGPTGFEFELFLAHRGFSKREFVERYGSRVATPSAREFYETLLKTMSTSGEAEERE